ncbi:MAG: hypothetical protein MJ238_00155 [Bacilli bacterium]|nr:hypothetical protein [Bacilli bacterium]
MDRKLFLKTSVVISSFLTFISASFAWFLSSGEVDFDDGYGYTAASYFHSGDGSDEKPYVINSPIHLYNLAWLQYLGEFNKKDETTQQIKQYYFELEEDCEIDMSGLVLPPIGTTNNPFIGVFNGNGSTIKNLRITNKLGPGFIEKKPLSVEGLSGVNIVGMFGVIGDYDGAGTYSSFAPSVSNVYLKDCFVETQLNQSLLGVAAGYVNGSLSGIGVSGSTISVASGTAPLSSVTTNLSDYTLVGYCTAPYRNVLNVSDTTIYTPTLSTEDDVYSGNEGSESAWGGSINMKSMYSRLNSIRSSSATRTTNYVYARNDYVSGTTITSTNSTNNYIWTYLNNKTNYNEKYGSFVFANASESNTIQNPQYIYLSGGTHVTRTTQSTDQTTAYRFYITNNNRNYYLNINNARNGVTSSTTANTYWALDGKNHLYTVAGNITYFLNVRNTGSNTTNYSFVVSTMPMNTWSIGTNNVTTLVEGKTVYLSGTNNNWTPRANEATLSLQSFNRSMGVSFSDDYVDYTGNNVTYFPLRTVSDNNFEVHEANTGYVVAGSHDVPDRFMFPLRTGDIRVSRYEISDNINTTSYRNGNIRSIYTVDDGGLHVIASNNTFEKYNDSKEALRKVMSTDGTYVYGLHFMNSSISMNNLVTAQYARVNKEEPHRNYQLPADCIDFNLKEKGFINFFAGTYFSGNNSFFSLHDIVRDSSENIVEIKEIKEIFGDNDPRHSYIYQYSDDSYSIGYVINADKTIGASLNTPSSIPSTYSSIFKTSWIKNQGSDLSTTKYMYYFEIPMNLGEYALGSVDGGTGAYLLYLDIAANAQKINYSIIHEEIKTVSKTYVYPYGVALAAPGGEVDDTNSIIAIAVAPSFSGTVLLQIDGTNATANFSSTTGISIGYIDESTSLRDKNSNLLDDDVVARETLIRRTHIIAVNTTTMAETHIIRTQGVDTIEMTRNDENGNDISSSITNDERIYFETRANSTDFVTLSGGNSALSLRYKYLDPTTVSLYFEVTVVDDDSFEGAYYKSLDGYNLVWNISGESESVNVKVLSVDGNFHIYINGELASIAQGDTFLI